MTNPNKFQSRKLPTLQRVAFGDHGSLRGNARGAATVELLDVADSAQRAWNAIQGNHERAMADETVLPFQRLVRSVDHAKALLGQVTAKHAAAREAAARRSKELEKTFDNACKPQGASGHLDGEIRDYVRKAFASGDASAITALLSGERPDADTVRALATAPAYLSGLSAELHSRAKSVWLGWHAPDELAEYQSLRGAIEAADTAADSLKQWSTEMIDFVSVDTYRAAQAKNAA